MRNLLSEEVPIDEWGMPFVIVEQDEKADPYDSKPKPKIKFNPEDTQEGFQHYVTIRADHIPRKGFATGKPEDFEWEYVPEFETAKTDAIKKDWVGWFQGEQDEWKYNHGDEKKGHFEKWSQDPFPKPIIFVEGTDGNLHIWDGHHRVGMAHLAKMKTIPALVGKRKSKKD